MPRWKSNCLPAKSQRCRRPRRHGCRAWGTRQPTPRATWPRSWPATTLESVRWVGDVDAIPRRHRGDYSGGYQANIVPPIASANAHLSAGSRAALDEATAHIARFDADMSNEIAPLASTLLRSESASSSRIEHLTASARAIAAAELGDTSRRNAAEIVANSTMMTAAIRLADHLNAESIIEMHRQLMEPMRPDIVGHWRTQQVWIGGSRHGPHTADFVPPSTSGCRRRSTT